MFYGSTKYAEAAAMLNGNSRKKVGYARHLHKWFKEGDAIEVEHHDTALVMLHKDNDVTIVPRNRLSVSDKRVINEWLPNGYKVITKDFKKMLVTPAGTVPIKDNEYTTIFYNQPERTAAAAEHGKNSVQAQRANAEYTAEIMSIKFNPLAAELAAELIVNDKLDVMEAVKLAAQTI